MKWGYLGVIVVVLAIVLLSGCLDEIQGKFKVEDKQLLCDEVEVAENFLAESSFGNVLGIAAVETCVNVCGSKENYSSYDCSGKYFTCYCERDPNDLTEPAAQDSLTGKTNSPEADENCPGFYTCKTPIPQCETEEEYVDYVNRCLRKS